MSRPLEPLEIFWVALGWQKDVWVCQSYFFLTEKGMIIPLSGNTVCGGVVYGGGTSIVCMAVDFRWPLHINSIGNRYRK